MQRKIFRLFGLLISAFSFQPLLMSQDIIINEVYNSSSTDEWIELLVVKDSLDLRNWNIRDFSSSGVAQPQLTLSSDAFWTNVRAGTIIVVARSENTFAEDIDKSDYVVVVKSNNVAYFSGTVFSLAGASEAIEIRNSSSAHIFGVSWGSANASSLTAPKVHFNLSSTSGTSASYSGGSVVGSDSTINWVFNNTSVTRGVGNTATNSNWITSMRPAGAQVGSGSTSIFPSRWRYQTPTDLQFTLKPQTDTLRCFRFKKPAQITWNTANISVQPTATISHDADTTTITNFALGGADSILVTITGVTASDTTDEFTFDFRSSTNDTAFLPIQVQPKTLVIGGPRSMSVVKRKETNTLHSLLGKWAVVRGIVTVANDFGGPSYLQDATAGIAVFDSSVSNNVTRGDDVVLLGLVAPFNDLFELTPCSILEKISEGNPVDTLILTALQVNGQSPTGSELYESKLIRVNGITLVTTTSGVPVSTWAVTGSGTNYNLTDPTGIVQARISPRVNLANLPTPTGTFDIVGVLGQFTTTYQLLPRSYDDIIIEGQGPRFISQAPFETSIAPTSLTFTWQTDVPGTSTVRYGKTTAYGSQQIDTNKVTQHQVTISGLKSATVYNVQLESANATGTTTTANYITSTSSQNSIGTMNVYFNKSVNTTVAQGENAQGNVSLSQKLIDRINAAAYSIDFCMYNLSGTVGSSVATALGNAKNRGLKVRVIGEKENITNAPWSTLANTYGITVIDDSYDATNAGAGLMHNKFAVFDNRDTTSETDDWLWTGSWNTTDPGTNSDLQNSIEIQDKSLANTFTLEFNEMWGSDSLTPSATNSRFGARKLDNTPHYFVINGTPVESYFSPSDRTTSQIIKTVNRAQHSINFALLTFTRTDIANALTAKKSAGRKVRGVMDNRTDQGSQFDSLVARGVDVRLDVNSGFLHHKYGIIDAETVSALQYTITGSHNWSSSAENSNNENTLIISSRRIANLYLQEFKARYLESNGTDNIVVTVEQVENSAPLSFSLSQNYPNPFNPTTSIELRIPSTAFAMIKVYDVLGREIAVLVSDQKSAGMYRVTWDASAFPSGVYFYRMQAGNFVETKRMLLMK